MRRLETQFPPSQPKHQIAISGDRNITRPFEIQRNLTRVASRRNFKVIFELILISIKGEIDTGINFTVLNPSKLRNIAQPPRRIISDEVVAVARESIRAGHLGVLICSGKLHLYRHLPQPTLRMFRQHQNSLGWRQVQPISMSVRQELYLGIALALIRFKTDGKTRKRSLNLGGSGSLRLGMWRCGVVLE